MNTNRWPELRWPHVHFSSSFTQNIKPLSLFPWNKHTTALAVMVQTSSLWDHERIISSESNKVINFKPWETASSWNHIHFCSLNLLMTLDERGLMFVFMFSCNCSRPTTKICNLFKIRGVGISMKPRDEKSMCTIFPEFYTQNPPQTAVQSGPLEWKIHTVIFGGSAPLCCSAASGDQIRREITNTTSWSSESQNTVLFLFGGNKKKPNFGPCAETPKNILLNRTSCTTVTGCFGHCWNLVVSCFKTPKSVLMFREGCIHSTFQFILIRV